jgi:MFS family permease
VARRILLDVTPLRTSPDFRLLWTGQLVSVIGRQVTTVAVPFQVFQLTGSSLMVGLVSAAQLGPLLACSLIGGSIADAVDRRRLMLVMQVLLGVTSVGLAVNASLGRPGVWPLFVLTAVSAGLSAMDSPTRSASIPAIVGLDQVPAALALNQSLFQTATVVGPAVAGVLIGAVGVGAAYWLDAATFAFAAATVWRLRPLPPHGGGTRAGLASILEGLRFLRGRRALQGTFVIDVNAMVFGMPRALFPALGTGLFGGGAATVGLLYAAPGAGALVGALTTGWVSSVRRQGRAVVLAVVVWGASIAAFGAVSWLPLALVLLAVAGAADVVSAVFRNTILQLSVPDRLRGRLSSVHIGVVTGGPLLGDAEAGAVAAVTTPRVAVVSGGLACVAGAAVVARLLPELARWTVADAVVEEAVAPAPTAGPPPGG